MRPPYTDPKRFDETPVEITESVLNTMFKAGELKFSFNQCARMLGWSMRVFDYQYFVKEGTGLKEAYQKGWDFSEFQIAQQIQSLAAAGDMDAIARLRFVKPVMTPETQSYWKLMHIAGLQTMQKGTDAVIKSPEQVWALACGYFEEVDANPFTRSETIKAGVNAGELIDTPVKRPYSTKGLEVYAFLNGAKLCLKELRTRPGYEEVSKMIDNIMHSQKFDNAMAGFFNAALTARELGIADTVNSNVKAETKHTFDVTKLSQTALEEIANLLPPESLLD